MRLIRLALTNFRQHADTVLDFRPGLTGIIGPNGSGKTTILEAIAWAIYGTPALRGTKDTLRFNRAPGRSAVRVDLEFELGGERYRVSRSPRNAELFRAGREDPIATGIGEVARQLKRRLGMTHQEFFNTYFTGQKELQFLATMGPVERARFLSQVLGYERLREAQNLVREQRKVLKGQVEELRRTLGDPEEIARTKEEARRRLQEARSAREGAQKRQAERAERFAELEPTWIKLQADRERDRQLKEDLRVWQTRLENALKERKKAEAELEKLATASQRLSELREQVRPLEGLSAEADRLRALSEAESRRRDLEKQLAAQRERVEALAGRLTDLEAKTTARDELAKKLASQEEECERLEAEREEATTRWQRDAQDVDARLRILLGNADDLEKQIQVLEEAGPDGVCPTCQRSLGAEYDRVLEVVRSRYEEVVQDGRWHRKRQEQLEAEPEDVAAARRNVTRAREALERLRNELAAVESARAQAASLQAELEAEESRARELAGAIASLPEGYDGARHRQVREQLERLRGLEKEVTQLETRLETRAQLKAAAAEAEEEERQVRAKIADLDSKRAAIGFSEAGYRRAGEEYESARVAREAAGLELERAVAEVDRAQQALDAALQEEKRYKQVSRSIRERESEHRLHNELDLAFGTLRDELNDRVRPELSEIASDFLTELTDGRYNRIEIDKDYQIVVLDDGEEKPVISGGEEDLANLVLRLAISQMIADRAGQTLSLLIFDEVFGGLDDQRRESVVRLLQRLQDRFEQVILITHIEPIREGMDQVARVTYDERTGTSVVRIESPAAAGEDFEVGDLAALVSD